MHPGLKKYDIRKRGQDLRHSAFFIEQICLAAATLIVLCNLISHTFGPFEHLFPAGLLHMRISSASAALCSSVALFLSEENVSKRTHRIGQILGVLTASIAGAGFWLGLSHSPDSLRDQLAAGSGSSLATPIAFLLLGSAAVLIRSHDSLWSHVADALASGLAFLVLILLSEFLFSLARIEGLSIAGPIKIPTLVCLALLTLAVIVHRAEHGIFSAFLAVGMDGRIVRFLAPILLSLPFLRELGRAHLLDAHVFPAHYATAVLTSTATVVAFALLLILSRFIKRMQAEIQETNLRDELTGLYNFRGFNLFAEQAFRLARRSGQPFGVLFADMDNLKLINDQLGHASGSTCIIETAKLLTATFRDTDVIGRLGGDEFVVAGHFDSQEIASAMERLRSAAAARKSITGGMVPLSLSLGYATTEHGFEDTLKAVVARADKMMYKEKREKKRFTG